MSYQKVYMNQVHSSSLLCQLAQMWKSQLLCDAIIKTGTVTTKAHRLVLVAACPMLQSMENASVGDHLEVRLAAEIKQDSVNTFLQYLYEGFMMLTEENVRDVEKVARLLQVESVVTCCSDFDKCMRSKMGMLPPGANYKYNFHDQVEFRHVRTTDLQKTVQERMMKRAAEMARPSSPGNKRQRMHRPSSPPVDVSSLSEQRFPSDRIPMAGPGGPSSRSGYVDHSSMPGVIEIAEDALELVHTEAPEGGTGPGRGHNQPAVKKSVAVSVASQINRNRELKVVNVTGDSETRTVNKPSPNTGPTSRGPITVSPLTIPVDSSPLSRDSSNYPKTPDSSNQSRNDQLQSNMEIPDFSQTESFMFSTPHSESSSERSPFPISLTQAGMSHSSKPYSSQGASKSKPFAAGSAMQSGYSPTQSYSQTSSQRPPHQRSEKSNSIERPSSASSDGKQSLSGNIKSDQSETGSGDMTPDLSIVKVEAGQRGHHVEPSDTGGLDMYVDMQEQGVMHMHHKDDDEDPGEVSDIEYEEPSGDWSNEGSNLSADQSASWHSSSFKESRVSKVGQSFKFKVGKQIQHEPVRIYPHDGSKKKLCVYCDHHNIVTPSRNPVLTVFKCNVCDVPLCKTKRDCFILYHKEYNLQ